MEREGDQAGATGAEAARRAAVLRPLVQAYLTGSGSLESGIRDAVWELGVSRATVWRWIRRLTAEGGRTSGLVTAQIPFQSCPECSRRGLALKHWRRAWAFDCQICGTRLAPIVAKPYGELLPEKLLRRARIGAGLLEQAATCNGTVRLRRAMRAVTFAMAIKNVRGDPAFALQVAT